MNLRWILALLCGVVTVSAADDAKPAGPPAYPVLRCPKLRAAPTIDGTLAPGEWAQAAALTGMVSHTLGGIVPNVQQVTFYLGYDDRFLYLAMHSPHKEGTYPRARCKENDNGAVLFEDHIEFQLGKHTRAQAAIPGYGFYKVMVNPRGAMTDQWMRNGTVGSEDLWSTGGTTKCTVTPTYWDLELSIEWAQMGLEKVDGRSLILWLARCDSCAGVYFTTWGPGTWMAWDGMPEVTFDPDAPAVQMLGLGGLMDGNPDLRFAFNANDDRPHTVRARVEVRDAAGAVVYEDARGAAVPAKGRAELAFRREGLALSPGGNQVRLDVREGEKVLYQVTLPLNKLTDEYRTKYLEPWLAGRPQSGEWDYLFAYRPSEDVAECGVDLDFFGVAPAVLRADACEVGVLTAGGQVLARERLTVRERRSASLLKLPKLAAGDYRARFTLYEGTKEIEAKDLAFVRHTYPWETQRLGLSDEVLPPYTPIVVGTAKAPATGTTLAVWGRTYLLGANGLPAAIDGYSRDLQMSTKLLRAPARFEVTAGGQRAAPADAASEVTAAAPQRVTLRGGETHGPVRLTTATKFEYDGWYETALTIAPAAPGTLARVDTLDLVLDLDPSFDTLYVHRANDSFVGSYYGDLPAGTGVVWASTSLPGYQDRWLGKDWQSFVPVTFVGTGSRGLWLYTWSDKGWALAAGDACVRVERDATGRPTLRARFLAGGVEVTTPRTLVFALLAAPVKPLPETYRDWRMQHDTSGYRYYGDSVDGYALPDDAAYDLFRRELLGGPQTDLAREKRAWRRGGFAREAAYNCVPIALYGSTNLTGAGMPEFDTYGGEWLGRTNWKPAPDTKFSGMPNYAGSVVWDTERKLTVVGVQLTPSYADCFVWYHEKLVAAGMNGTWFDNCSISLIKRYDPELGRMDTTFNQAARRDLMKRLSTVGWQHLRRPCWITNLHEDFSFADVAWLVENEWYIKGEGMTMLDNMPLGTFRALACSKTMQLVAKPWIHWPKTKDEAVNRHVERSITAVLLAHDVQNGPMDAKLRRWLQFHLDFLSARACKFRGYWDVAKTLADPGAPEVKCSVYFNPTRRNAVLWLLNAGKDDRDAKGLTFSGDLLGRAELRTAFDAESGAALAVDPAGETKGVKSYRLTAALPLRAHEFRAIAIGAEE